MRGRLLLSTLTIALVAVVTLGVPLLLLARHEVWTSARDTLRQQAASIAAGLEDRLDVGEPVDLRRYVDAVPHRRILVRSPQGKVTVAGPRLTGPVLTASVTVADSTITVQASQHPTIVRAREATLLVVGLALLAVTTAVGLAVRQARRLSAPLSELVQRAEALGRGEFAPAPVTSGIVEIDSISRVLERSTRQIATMIELQRDFASDAAHQLRTPLTGIGLRLDELSRIGDPTVHQEAEQALAQVERLGLVISALLARARGDAADPTDVDLTELLEHEAPAWSRALSAHDRTLVLDLQPGMQVWARREHLAAIIGCLLDNALQHGAGTVTMSSRSLPRSLEVVVSDQGPGVPIDLVPHVFERRVSGSTGTGIGLALARSLAAAEGGQLDLVDGAGSRWQLTLPTTHFG